MNSPNMPRLVFLTVIAASASGAAVAATPVRAGEQTHGRLDRVKVAAVQISGYDKTDLPRRFDPAALPDGIPVVPCALAYGTGLAELRAALTDKIHCPGIGTGAPHAVISERHREIILDARKYATEARELLLGGREENVVLAASCLRQGIEALGRATGRTYSEELLDAIFSRFCVGK